MFPFAGSLFWLRGLGHGETRGVRADPEPARRRYYYYFVTAAGGKIWWKKYLTTLQITQFVVDIVVVYFAGPSPSLSSLASRAETLVQPTRTLPPSTSPLSLLTAAALAPREQPSWAADSSLRTSSSSSCVPLPLHPKDDGADARGREQGFYKATYKKPVVAGKKPTTAIADFKKAQ